MMHEQTLKEQKKYERRMGNAIRSLASSPDGRYFLLQIINKTGVFNEVFDTNNSIQSMKAGKQSVGLWLLAELKSVDEKIFLEVMTTKEI